MKHLALVTLMASVACSGSSDDAGPAADSGTTILDGSDPIIDGGFDPDGGPVRTVEVGTGVDFFVPITTDQVMELTLGPQGGGRNMGYHIWSAIKVTGFVPRMATVRFKILEAGTRREIARQQRTLNLMPSGGAHVAYGVAPWIDDCCPARNAALIMHAEIEDSTGATGEHERQVIGADRCPDPGGADICP